MNPFITLNQVVCAPLAVNEVDTDVIYPGRFLSTTKRTGLSSLLFHDLRHTKLENNAIDTTSTNKEDTHKEDHKDKHVPFVLDQVAYQNAQVMVVGDHFGCGSSREHAPWALLDFGIRCLISTRFGDIFLDNCFKNGILCITLPQEQVDRLMKYAHDQKLLSIDLPQQLILLENHQEIAFSIDSYVKTSLLQGLDEIEQTMRKLDQVKAFEQQHYQAFPWLNPQ